MRVRLKGITENNLEELVNILSQMNINPSSLYKALSEGKDEAKLTCSDKDLPRLREKLAGLCDLELEEDQKPQSLGLYSMALLGLFLDNLLVFYLLKLSFLSQDFSLFLESLLRSSAGASWLRAFLSLLFIVLYNTAFLHGKGAPPVSGMLGLSFRSSKHWLVVAYSVPLLALYLMQTGITAFSFLGLFLLSLSIGLVLSSK